MAGRARGSVRLRFCRCAVVRISIFGMADGIAVVVDCPVRPDRGYLPVVIPGLCYGGLVVALASFLYSFFVVAKWFVGPPN